MDTPAGYQLPAKWAKYLAERGVTPEVARARGYQYVRAGKPIDGDFAAAWGFNQKLSGLLLPIHGLLDPDPPAVQLRLDNPELYLDAKGKPRRFRTPSKQRNVLATSPLTRERLKLPNELIFVAEGVTRVDALAAYCIPAVGLLGINNWRAGNPPAAIADFEALGIKGNVFVIAPDGDVRTNKMVHSAVTRLRQLLLGRGAAKVMVMAVPGTQGLDDWLAEKQFPDQGAVHHAILELCTDRITVVPQPTGDNFGIEDAGPWSCTPAGDVRRLLEFAPDRFCVVQGAPGRPWRLLVEQEGGRWSSAKDEAAVGELHMKSALGWQRRVSEAVMKGEIKDADQANYCTKWAITSAKHTGVRDLLAVVGQTYRFMEDLRILPPQLTDCREDALDANRLVLGAPNGVISLDTGKLLSDAEARATFTTRFIPDRFEPDAEHEYADMLVAHLTKEDRTYLLSALGYGLRGNPARRIYGLVGERGGGKSTLLTALVESLGDVRLHGYAMAVAIEAFLASRWNGGSSAHHGNLIGMQDARFAVSEEPPARSTVNVSLLKDLSGGRPQAIRDVGEKTEPARAAKATIIIAVNSGQEHVLDTKDAAFADRVRLLLYPKLTVAPDTERIAAFSEIAEARQAVAAMLVRWAASTRERPKDPRSVQAYTELRRQDSIGQVGQYIESTLQVTGKTQDFVLLDSFIEAVAASCGGKDSKGLIEGLDRKDILRLSRELVPGLPRSTPRKGALVWPGVVHTSFTEEEESDPDADGISEMVCTRCGSAQPLEKLDLTAGVCIAACGDSDDAPPSAPAGHGQPQRFDMGADPMRDHIVLDDALRAQLARVEKVRAKVLVLLEQQGETDPGLSPDVIYADHERAGTLQEELPTPVRVRVAILNRHAQGLRLFREALKQEHLTVEEVEELGGAGYITKFFALGTSQAAFPIERANTDDFVGIVKAMRLEARERIAARRSMWQRLVNEVQQLNPLRPKRVN